METLTLVIFGITGNLTQKYLLPALYDMVQKDMLPKNISIIGIARKDLSEKQFLEYIEESLNKENIHHRHEIKKEVIERLVQKMRYLQGNLDDPNLYHKLKSLEGNHIYYLATHPGLYYHVFENLQRQGMSKQTKGWVRLMIEKPIGHDLKSARELNHLVSNYFTEDQIYRLDHYLGKETLQNMLTFRFGNGIFEPLINSTYIDHIQITASEDFGIGKRGSYYDSVGALIDVGQNHLLQMLTFATMDAPSKFSNKEVTKERINILQKLKPNPNKIIFGQYEGYTEEENINTDSNTETYFAFKTEIESDRFKNVPIYIRGGKKLTKTVTEISIVFKNPINRLFKHLECGNEPNILIYRIQPNEGIVLKILTKKPGSEIKLEPEYMQFCYKQDSSSHYLPDPYERLLQDAIKGDQTFFSDATEVEAEWAFIDELVKPSRQDFLIDPRGNPIVYKPGSWGPKEADKLLEEDGRCWLEPSMEFCRI